MGLRRLKLAQNIFDWLHERRRRLATGAVGMLACLVLFHVVFGANGIFIYAQKRSEFKKVNDDIERLQLENGKLDQNIQSLKTDPKAIEKEAREQLKYVRPGEVVYTTPVPRQAPSTATAQK